MHFHTSFLVALCVTVVGMLGVEGAMKSAFKKDVDISKLSKEWKDGDLEDDDWHEDTYEWEEKERKKKSSNIQFDPKNPQPYLQQAMAGGGMQMVFVTLKPETEHKDKKQTTELALRWQQMLATDGLRSQVYPIGPNQVLFTENDGRVLEMNAFIMKQPEVLKLRWKDKDQYPPGATPTPAPQPRKIKKKVKRVKKKKADDDEL